MTDCSRRYDYIIIGSGTSGSVLARTLLDRCMVSILVLEMGRNNNINPLVMDAANAQQAETSPIASEAYQIQRDPNVLNKTAIVNLGKCWGGTSSQDDMLAIRPSQTYLRQIEQMSGIPLALMNSYFKRIERYIPRPGSNLDPSRGTEGPMTVTQLALGSTVDSLQRVDSTAVINGTTPGSNGFVELLGTSAGVAVLQTPADDYNATSAPETFTGAHQQAFVQDMGHRWTRQQTGANYLDSKVVYPNGKGVHNYDITVIDRAKVTKINFVPVKSGCSDRVRPVSVDAWVDLKCCTFFAECGVIIAAGPFETPALLQRSGIGPSSLLDQLCINKVITNEHVGRHLVGHYGSAINFWLQFAPATSPNPAQIESNLSLIAELPDAALTTNLPTTIYPSTYVPSRAKQLYSNPTGSAPNGAFGVEIDYWSNLPRTEGYVEISALNAFSQPVISMPAFATAEEKAALISTWRQVATQLNAYVTAYNLANPPTLSVVWPVADPLTATDDEVLQMGLESAIKTHPVGTARMAPVGFGVVDSGFQVHGTCGLFVADISVLPLMPDADPSWTSMALGMHFAEIIAVSCSKRRCDPNDDNSYSLCRTIVCDDGCGKKGCVIKPYNRCDDDCCESPCDNGDCGNKHSKKPKPCVREESMIKPKPKPKHESSSRQSSSSSRHQKESSSSGAYGWK